MTCRCNSWKKLSKTNYREIIIYGLTTGIKIIFNIFTTMILGFFYISKYSFGYIVCLSIMVTTFLIILGNIANVL